MGRVSEGISILAIRFQPVPREFPALITQLLIVIEFLLFSPLLFLLPSPPLEMEFKMVPILNNYTHTHKIRWTKAINTGMISVTLASPLALILITHHYHHHYYHHYHSYSQLSEISASCSC